MKKFFVLALLALMPFLAKAQGVKFAYFSYEEVLKAMPEYSIARRDIDELHKQYDAEADRASKEFNGKYEDFLDQQRTLAPSIRQKRQAELVDLMERNLAFRKESERLLANAERERMEPLHAKLKAAVQQMGKVRGYAFILNTDNNALPYVDAAQGDDITEALKLVMR